MKSKFMTRLLVITLIGTTTFTTACFGNFSLTRGIYGWNKTVSSNKFVQWIVFLGLVIIPVYEIGALADLFVFNALEFWTGSNPLASRETPQSKEIALGEGKTMFMTNWGDQLDVQIRHEGQVETAFSFVTTEDGMTMLDADGSVVAKVKDMDGAVEVVNALGQSVATYSADQTNRVSAAYESNGTQGAIQAVNSLGTNDSGVAAR
jgi:hypothetical protein